MEDVRGCRGREAGIWLDSEKGMVLAAGNVTDGMRTVALALDEPASIEREITGYVETTIDEDTLTLQMQPHSFMLLWLR